eukprot:CAMPEP_0204278552 /NCGR_PEP_ID=MMETSP0468-20130131/31311_1 /ASSEMBLY_ACC=CAM_ASM_000383 /TAXON_ID=2969 /ORGANISM="Oxyrrhis marina" /LENGTH=371 /DNA_ID=CAMNT_0051255477 /DNA_START=33 /DNA_END=1148 /DNA_ORIENTATION=+
MTVQSKEQVYGHAYPDDALGFRSHFSSLLFSGSWGLTALEAASLASLFGAVALVPKEKLDVGGSMPFQEFARFLLTKAVVTRVYNSYLEAVFFAFPKYRTQPSREHALQQKKDLCGRDMEQLTSIHRHDGFTMMSQFGLNLALYFGVPGFFPASSASNQPMHEKILRLLGNHYVMSFGMYWMHRALHVVPIMWEKIHSFHHWARHPLSRNTYQDHWLDNFCNAIVGHGFAQVLVPLDNSTFWFSHVFRIFESLEKHSGVSCGFNLAHTMQRWLPFAQMPHHHDWHHEGHKGCNYTFSSLGGVWDCVFGTRKAGRAADLLEGNATRWDKQPAMGRRGKTVLDNAFVATAPVVAVGIAAGLKLQRDGFRVLQG